MRRLLLIFLALALPVIAVFLIWGDWWDRMFSLEESVAWLRRQGSWAGAAGVALLLGDLVLPVPSTVVMTALGVVYGVGKGTLLNLIGSLAGGLAGYALGRVLPREKIRRWIGEEDWAESERLFQRAGPLAVAASRALPVFPEAISCLAGLMRLKPSAYVAALTLGSAPMAFIFALLGQYASVSPGLALITSLIPPPILWLVSRRLLRAS